VHILLVEDDALLGDGVFTGLKRVPYEVDWVKNGESALEAIHLRDYDVLILDIGLPKISGIEVLKTARNNGYKNPVLILTAQDALEQKIQGLDAGADDYLIKPFAFDELCARLRALSRRPVITQSDKLSIGNIVIDLMARTIELSGEPQIISRREFDLLLALAKSPGQVFSKTQLEEKLYSWNDEIGSNAIEVHVHHLRKKLGSDIIKNSRGVGYYVEKQIN